MKKSSILICSVCGRCRMRRSTTPTFRNWTKTFERAVIVLPKPKASICIRLDQEVLDWFKTQGKGYQTRINALLRAYMEAQSKG